MKKILAVFLLIAVAVPVVAANGSGFDMASGMNKFWNETDA